MIAKLSKESLNSMLWNEIQTIFTSSWNNILTNMNVASTGYLCGYPIILNWQKGDLWSKV